jgi:hypothetical protein
MTDGISWDEPTVRLRALTLLSLADCVNSEGWGDAVAAQLRQAAHDLLSMATGAIAADEVARQPKLR